ALSVSANPPSDARTMQSQIKRRLKGNPMNRRDVLRSGIAGTLGAFVPYTWTAGAEEQTQPRSPNERWNIGAIGMRSQGSVITEKARLYGEVVAIADVDRHVREQARASFGSTPRIFEDYRQLLDRDDVDVVMIATPDHWHAIVLIDAVRAGKDVYCEKRLTLTVAEGRPIIDAVNQTQRVREGGLYEQHDTRLP